MKHLFFITCILCISALSQGQEEVKISRVMLQNTPVRTMAIGWPNQNNLAFDTVQFSPSYIWTGDFINFKNEKSGRGGRACQLNGDRVNTGIPTAPLRFANTEMPKSIEFKGYRNALGKNPIAYAKVDGQAASMSFSFPKEKILQTTISFEKNRTVSAFYLTAKIAKDKITLGKGLSWAKAGVILIPVGVNNATITFNFSNNTAIKQKQEKETGASLFQQLCSACHSTTGIKLIGPSFKKLWGKKEIVITAGKERSITIDAAYIKSSILKPQQDIVKGYEKIPMPPLKLNDKQIKMITDYIKGLGI